MKKLIIFILIISLCLQQLAAAGTIFTILKKYPDKKFYLKDTQDKYYLTSLTTENINENIQENKDYPGEIISASVLLIHDFNGNTHYFTYVADTTVSQTEAAAENGAISWWQIAILVILVILLVSSSRGGGGGGGGSAY